MCKNILRKSENCLFLSLERMPMILIQKSTPVFPKSSLLQKGKFVMWRDLLTAVKQEDISLLAKPHAA